MALLMNWLKEPWTTPVPMSDFGSRIPDVETPSRLQVLACLMGINGGSGEVRGWGYHHGGGLYGTVGLDQEAALELIQLNAYVNGWMAGTENAEETSLADALTAEWERVAIAGARCTVVRLAEAAGHENIVPRDAKATDEEIAAWLKGRHAAACVDGPEDFRGALEAYARLLKLELQ